MFEKAGGKVIPVSIRIEPLLGLFNDVSLDYSFSDSDFSLFVSLLSFAARNSASVTSFARAF